MDESRFMRPLPALSDHSFLGRPWRRPVAAALRVGAIATLVILGAAGVGAENAVRPNVQFQPGQPWLDAQGMHLNAHGFCLLDFGGRHYWYGAHKIAGRTEAEKNEAGVRCYVSDDLLNWQDAGLVLSVFAPGAHPDLADASILDRPKVIYHAATQKFILYFKLYPPKSQGGKTGTDYAYVGVATATQPTGPFDYQGRFLGGNSHDFGSHSKRGRLLSNKNQSAGFFDRFSQCHFIKWIDRPKINQLNGDSSFLEPWKGPLDFPDHCSVCHHGYIGAG